MPYELCLEEHPGYLHARATGPHTPRNALRFLIEAAQALRDSRHTDLLLEFALTGPSLTGGMIYEIVAERSADGAQFGRIAYLDQSTERRLEHLRFAETIARNRGVRVRLFRTLPDAQA